MANTQVPVIFEQLSLSFSPQEMNVLKRRELTGNYFYIFGTSEVFINSRMKWLDLFYFEKKISKILKLKIIISRTLNLKIGSQYIKFSNNELMNADIIYNRKSQFLFLDLSKRSVRHILKNSIHSGEFENDINTRNALVGLKGEINIPFIEHSDERKRWFQTPWTTGRVIDRLSLVPHKDIFSIFKDLSTVYDHSGRYELLGAEKISEFKSNIEKLSCVIESKKLESRLLNILGKIDSISCGKEAKICQVNISHGDLFLKNNILFSNNGPCLLDWGDSGKNTLYYDVVFMILFDDLRHDGNELVLFFQGTSFFYDIFTQIFGINLTRVEHRINILFSLFEIIITRALKLTKNEKNEYMNQDSENQIVKLSNYWNEFYIL